MEKIEVLFQNANDPSTLARKVWFLTTYHFGLRGRELQAKLRKQDLDFIVVDGSTYCQLAAEFATKNNQGGATSRISPDAGIICKPDDVQCLRFYLRKLNPNCDRLFQRPKTRYSHFEPTWFDALPMGKNQMSSMMKAISMQAGCQTQYTNHCLRSTTVTALHASGVSDRDIMRVTGHRNSARATRG
eukprot:scpid6132/ scgid28703/ 